MTKFHSNLLILMLAGAIASGFPVQTNAAQITINGTTIYSCSTGSLDVFGNASFNGCTGGAGGGGSCTASTTMPNLVNLSTTAADDLIASSGLLKGATNSVNSAAAANIVVSQSVPPGQSVCNNPPVQISYSYSNGTPPATNGDPGIGTKTWIPPNSTNFWVVDQSGPPIQSNRTYVPGCVNNTGEAIATCGQKYSYAIPGGGSITMALGNVVSVRYNVGATYTQGEYFQLNSGGGSGISYPIEATLTVNPGDFAPADADCKVTGARLATPRIKIGDAVGQCHLEANRVYYLNLRTTGTTACTGTGCVYMISEPLSIAN